MSNEKPLPYGRQWIEDDDVAAVAEQLRDDWLTQGPTVAAFEQALASATGARFAVAVSSGTAALHIACLAAGVDRDAVGIAPDVTFVATANAIRYCGGEPALVDIDPETGLVSVAGLHRRVADLRQQGRHVSALLPVSFAGAVPDLPAIQVLARSVGALVIEDCAHALGATYQVGGVTFRAGSCAHADLATLSFHPVKHITTGEGGAVTTNDEALYRKLCDLRSHGITKDPARLRQNDGPWYYEQLALGFNYRLTDIQSALGLSQLKKLAHFVDRRRELARRYDRNLRAPELAARFSPLRVPDGVASAYHLYVIRIVAQAGEALDAIAARRLQLFLGLREAGIHCQVHYIPIHTQPDYEAAGFGGGAFPGALAYYASCISLPLFPAMADTDVDRVIEALRSSKV